MMNILHNLSPYIYSMGRTVRNKNLLPYTVSMECCNVFIFVTNGKAVHEVNGRKRILEKGTLEIIPPFFHQAIYAQNEADTEIYYIYFDLFEKNDVHITERKPSNNDVRQGELYFIDKSSCKKAGHNFERINGLVNSIQNSFEKDDEWSFLERKSYMLELLTLFFRAECYYEDGDTEYAFGHVGRAIRYIEKNYGDKKLCSKNVAGYLDLNTEYLSKLFIKQVHTSLSEYIRTTRISRAKELFLLNRNIEKVADMCGFSSVQSFCRTFKKCTGITPSNYIAQL